MRQVDTNAQFAVLKRHCCKNRGFATARCTRLNLQQCTTHTIRSIPYFKTALFPKSNILHVLKHDICINYTLTCVLVCLNWTAGYGKRRTVNICNAYGNILFYVKRYAKIQNSIN